MTGRRALAPSRRRPVLVALGLALGAPLAAQSASPRLERSDTTLRAYDGRDMPAVLLRLPVPERHARPARTITQAAFLLPSTAERPGRGGRAIVFLMGGPGIPGSVMAPIPPYFTLFQRLRELGDNPAYTRTVLKEGAERARAKSSTVLARVKERMGYVMPFDQK